MYLLTTGNTLSVTHVSVWRPTNFLNLSAVKITGEAHSFVTTFSEDDQSIISDFVDSFTTQCNSDDCDLGPQPEDPSQKGGSNDQAKDELDDWMQQTFHDFKFDISTIDRIPKYF